VRTLEHWKGTLSIAIAISTPFSAWALGEMSLRAALVAGLIAGMTGGYNWIDSSITRAQAEAKQREHEEKLAQAAKAKVRPPRTPRAAKTPLATTATSETAEVAPAQEGPSDEASDA
jgi:hypothetical protein